MTTHRLSRTPIYVVWANMKQRCLNKNHPQSKDYFYRGIIICDRWKNSFENFYFDMGDITSSKHTLERIDNEKGYYPENCTWVTMKTQVNNRRILSTNKTGVEGVYFNKKSNKYMARYKDKYLGLFLTIEEAEKKIKNIK